MQDLDDGVRTGRDLLSALPADTGPKVRPFLEDVAVVPADRLLEVASALSHGASVVHERLRGLGVEERAAVLDAVADQVGTIVHLWVDLVQEVVAPESVSSEPSHTPMATTATHPVSTTLLRPRRAEGAVTEMPARTAPHVAAPTTRLARRATPSDRNPWAPPLRSVRAEDTDSGHEGDRLTRDELTGVLNRQAGFAALGRELDRARRAGDRFVLGYLDVDALKAVNDSEGTRSGDELLRKVTAALRATLRSYDIIMRLGGDEFLFSLPGADVATAERRAHEFGVLLAEEAPGASASVGFGELRGNDTLDEIISRAEAELVKSRHSRVRAR
jgi:diguanylate cyclase (GGDEF)-like protein